MTTTPHPGPDRTAKGRAGEQFAAAYLTHRGYRVIATNQRTPLGELDLVCRLGREVVIVEVKARTGDGFGTGLEAIGPRKVQRLRVSAMWWLSERGWLPCRIRFDAVVVGLDAEGTPRTVLHIPDLVAGEGL